MKKTLSYLKITNKYILPFNLNSMYLISKIIEKHTFKIFYRNREKSLFSFFYFMGKNNSALDNSIQ